MVVPRLTKCVSMFPPNVGVIYFNFRDVKNTTNFNYVTMKSKAHRFGHLDLGLCAWRTATCIPARYVFIGNASCSNTARIASGIQCAHGFIVRVVALLAKCPHPS